MTSLWGDCVEFGIYTFLLTWFVCLACLAVFLLHQTHFMVPTRGHHSIEPRNRNQTGTFSLAFKKKTITFFIITDQNLLPLDKVKLSQYSLFDHCSLMYLISCGNLSRSLICCRWLSTGHIWWHRSDTPQYDHVVIDRWSQFGKMLNAKILSGLLTVISKFPVVALLWLEI